MFYSIDQFLTKYPTWWEIGKKSRTFRWLIKTSDAKIATHKTKSPHTIVLANNYTKKNIDAGHVSEFAHELWHSLGRCNDYIRDEVKAYEVQCKVLLQLNFHEDEYFENFVKGYLEGDVFKYNQDVLEVYKEYYNENDEDQSEKTLAQKGLEFTLEYLPPNFNQDIF